MIPNPGSRLTHFHKELRICSRFSSCFHLRLGVWKYLECAQKQMLLQIILIKNDKCSVEELAILFASTRHRASNFILESAGDPHQHLIRNLLLRCQLSTSGLQEGRDGVVPLPHYSQHSEQCLAHSTVVPTKQLKIIQ